MHSLTNITRVFINIMRVLILKMGELNKPIPLELYNAEIKLIIPIQLSKNHAATEVKTLWRSFYEINN